MSTAITGLQGAWIRGSSNQHGYVKNSHFLYLGLPDSGDSRVKQSSPPTKFVTGLKHWLKTQFGKDLVYQGDNLEHGYQRNVTSYSILCRSTIAVNVGTGTRLLISVLFVRVCPRPPSKRDRF